MPHKSGFDALPNISRRLSLLFAIVQSVMVVVPGGNAIKMGSSFDTELDRLDTVPEVVDKASFPEQLKL